MVCLIERERGEGIGLNISYSILMLDSEVFGCAREPPINRGEREGVMRWKQQTVSIMVTTTTTMTRGPYQHCMGWIEASSGSDWI